MEKKFNINDLELFIKSFKYCYFLEGDNKTHKKLDDSLELIQKLRKLVVKETETKKSFILNYHVGGTPSEGGCLGIYDTYEKALKQFNSVVEDYELKSKENEIYEEREGYIYWDAQGGDFWGVLEIEEKELNKLK